MMDQRTEQLCTDLERQRTQLTDEAAAAIRVLAARVETLEQAGRPAALDEMRKGLSEIHAAVKDLSREVNSRTLPAMRGQVVGPRAMGLRVPTLADVPDDGVKTGGEPVPTARSTNPTTEFMRKAGATVVVPPSAQGTEPPPPAFPPSGDPAARATPQRLGFARPRRTT